MTDTQSDKPLAGKTIVVTRARAQAGKLAGALEDLGATVIEFPTIEIQGVESPPEIAALNDFDWVVFTSANAVDYFAATLDAQDSPFAFGSAKVCAVGPATREALEARGVSVDLVPEEFVAEAALDALRVAEDEMQGKRILLPRGSIARDVLPEGLCALGAHVTDAVVYRTVRPEVSDEAKDALVAARPDLVTFTSASTARHYVEILGPERIEALDGVAYASIGPQTTDAAEQAGLEVAIEPARHDVPGLVEAITTWFTENT